MQEVLLIIILSSGLTNEERPVLRVMS